MYQKIENNKEAINKVLEYLKAKTKVQIKLFQVKMTRVSCIRETLKELANCHLRFGGFEKLTSNVMLICLEVKQHASMLHLCTKTKGTSELVSCSKKSSTLVPTTIYSWCIQVLKTSFNLEIIHLEVKKQTQIVTDFFRSWNATRNEHVSLLKTETYQAGCG